MSSQTSNSNNNTYRLGDYVYFETTSTTSAYAIRRIEELNRTPNGNVEARVLCFYRRSDVPKTLLAQSDKVPWNDAEHGNGEVDSEDEDIHAKEKAKHQMLKEREIFLSRQMETLPAMMIRGKCSVTPWSEVETANSYVSRDDSFYYALVYDSQQKTLQEPDQGEIKIGSQYQATVPPVLADKAEDERGEGVRDESGVIFPELEQRLWVPSKQTNDENGHVSTALSTVNHLTDSEIEKFLVIARSVGTFARSLDCSSSVKQPSLHMSAAAASRDITLFHAHSLLHTHNYDLAEAMRALVPTTGPILCRDQMEDWSASEANLFEEAIEKYGKDFNDIRKDFLPWKSMRNIIEYFFMWKTTDRYVQQKRIKAMEQESKLKQVFVPAYSNKTTRHTGPNGEVFVRGRDCELYPSLPRYSWSQYKKYAKFVPATSLSAVEDLFIVEKSSLPIAAQRLAQLRPGLIIEPDLSSVTPQSKSASGKARAAFFLRTTPMTVASRRLCRSSIKLKHHARRLGKVIDLKAVKAETMAKAALLDAKTIQKMNRFRPRSRVNMEVVVRRLGMKDTAIQDWLVLTPKDKIPKPEVESFPRPAKCDDGSYIYERIPPTAQALKAAGSEPRYSGPQAQIYKKRQYQEKQAAAAAAAASGSESTAAKLQRTNSGHPISVFPKRMGPFQRLHGHRHGVPWMDAPDDVCFKAGPVVKRLRKLMQPLELKRSARKPFKKLLNWPSAV